MARISVLLALIACTSTPSATLKRVSLVVAERADGDISELLAAYPSGGDVLVSKLVGLGTDGMSDLLRMAAVGKLGDGADGEVLSPGQRASALAALTAHSHSALVKCLSDLDVALLQEPERILAIQLLSDRGDGSDLTLIFRIAVAGDDPRLSTRLRHEVTDAIEQIVRSDPRATWTLQQLYGESDARLLAGIVRGIERGAGQSGIPVLARLLGRVPEMDAMLLTAIANQSAGMLRPTDESACASVRPFLSSRRMELVRLAARAAGKLGDEAAISALLDLLGGEDAELAKEAHRALRSITGLALRPDVEVWEDWYLTEISWGATRGPELLGRISRMDQTDLASAILEISKQRLSSPEIVDALVMCLSHAHADIVGLACASLGKRRSRHAVDDLIDLLGSSKPRIRSAARSALSQILSRDLGDDPDEWRSAPEIVASLH